MSCAICLEDDAQKEFFVTDCNHVFHKECLLSIKEQPERSLLVKHNFTILNCPLCRYKLSLYDLNYKSFSTEILDHNVFKQIKYIYKQFKKLHLNPNYVFISGGFATALYAKLTNKNNILRKTTLNRNRIRAKMTLPKGAKQQGLEIMQITKLIVKTA